MEDASSEEDGQAPPPVEVVAGSEGATKLLRAVDAQLASFLGDTCTDEVLSEYIVVMVSHGKAKRACAAELDAFLGDNAGRFVEWLWKHLEERGNEYAATTTTTATATAGDEKKDDDGSRGRGTRRSRDVSRDARGRDESRERSRDRERRRDPGRDRDGRRERRDQFLRRSSSPPRGRGVSGSRRDASAWRHSSRERGGWDPRDSRPPSLPAGVGSQRRHHHHPWEERARHRDDARVGRGHDDGGRRNLETRDDAHGGGRRRDAANRGGGPPRGMRVESMAGAASPAVPDYGTDEEEDDETHSRRRSAGAVASGGMTMFTRACEGTLAEPRGVSVSRSAPGEGMKEEEEEEDEPPRVRREPRRRRPSLQVLQAATSAAAAEAWSAARPSHADRTVTRQRGESDVDGSNRTVNGIQSAAGAKRRGREEAEEAEVEAIKKRMRLVSAQLSRMTRKQNVIRAVLEQSKATPEERSAYVLGLGPKTSLSAVAAYFSRCGSVRRTSEDTGSGGQRRGSTAEGTSSVVTVEFASATSAARALKLSGTYVDGRRIEVRRTEEEAKACLKTTAPSTTATAFQRMTARGSMKWVRSDAAAATGAAIADTAAAATETARPDAMVA